MATRKRIMREFAIHEISAVDRPAQEGARALLLKRANGDAKPKTEVVDQTNPSVVLPEVTKTSDLPVIDNAKEPNMETNEKLTALEAELEVAKAKLKLPLEVLKYCSELPADEQPAFLAKSSKEQKAIVASAAEELAKASTVVYTDLEGRKYTKADEPRLIEMAKAHDALLADVQKAKAEILQAEYVKRAEALAHLPGDVSAQVALLKAVDGIADETQRAAALAMLQSKSDAAAAAFKSVGHTGTGQPSTAEAELEQMAKDYAKTHNVTKAVAVSEVLKTADGRALYAKVHG